jgi:hypothetical protein
LGTAHSKAVGHAKTGGFAFVLDKYRLGAGIHRRLSRAGEPIARPVQQTKHMLDALARKPVCATMELDMPTRRFPPPWSVEELTPVLSCATVRDFGDAWSERGPSLFPTGFAEARDY